MGMLEQLKDLWSDSLAGKLIITVVFLVVILIPVVVYAQIKEQEKWDIFAIEHQCRAVEYRKAETYTGTGFSSDGKAHITQITKAAQTAYKCNDGVIYWR